MLQNELHVALLRPICCIKGAIKAIELISLYVVFREHNILYNTST